MHIGKAKSKGEHRLHVILSEDRFARVTALSQKTDRSITELVKLGLGLIEILLNHYADGHRFVITDSEGQHISEVIIPW